MWAYTLAVFKTISLFNSTLPFLQDLAFTDEQCLHMMFITQGGGFDSVNKRTSKHIQTPVVTDEKICIRPCGPGE